MNVKVIYKKCDKLELNNFISKLKDNCSNIKIYKEKYKGKIDLIFIFANDYLTLKCLINKISTKEKIVIITSNINSNYIVKCLEFSSCICYSKGNIAVILKKIINLYKK